MRWRSLVEDGRGRARLREALDGVRDIERLAGRAAAGRATPRELGALRDSFQRLPDVAEALSGLASELRRSHEAVEELDLLADLSTELAAGTRDPASRRRSPRVASSAQDTTASSTSCATLRDGGKQYIASLQQRERERTGIPSLKVGYNKVFGYYLEITNAHAAKVPADYERRQTLATRGALRDARAQGLRGEGARRRGADGRAGGRAVRRAAGSGGTGHRADAADGAGARATRRVDGARRARGDASATSGPECTTGSTWRCGRAGIR